MKRPHRRLALLGTVLAVGLATTVSAAPPDGAPVPDGHVRVAGTHVYLAVPDGFALSDDFPGIGRDVDVTSVLVTELPVPLALARPSLEADALEARGVALHASAVVEVDGREALLVHASQRQAGMDFRKWMLLFGDASGSVLVTATTPREHEARYQEALVGALRSVAWRPDEAAEEPEPLPFAFRAPAPFEVVSRAANAVVLTDRGRAGEGGGIAPLVSVGASLSRVDLGAGLAAFAEQRLRETPSLESIEVESQAARALGELPGHEIRGRARDAETGRPVRFVQLLAAREGRYYLVQAIAEPEDAGSTLSAYDALTESFRLR